MRIYILFIIPILFLILIGLFTKPRLDPINFSILTNSEKLKPCNAEKVPCQTTFDCQTQCSEASEGESMVCRSFPDNALTETQRKLLGIHSTDSTNSTNTNGKNLSYCVSEKAKIDCNSKHGGIPVLNGSDMTFECLCSYPLWANGRKCEKDENKDGNTCVSSCELNPDICKGGTFNWDLTKVSEEPTASLCECGIDNELIETVDGLPRCVPVQMRNFYSDIETETENLNTRQIDSINAIKMSSIPPHGVQGKKCGDNFCPLPNGICFDNNSNYCCVGNYDTLVNTSDGTGKCVRKTCSVDETVCGNGCASMKNAVCCSDNFSYCPENTVCDIANKKCNPKASLLLKTGNGPVCSNGMVCPILNGVCVNDSVCCPPTHPVYDILTQSCKK